MIFPKEMFKSVYYLLYGRFKLHPALSLDPEFDAKLMTHPFYCYASLKSVERLKVVFRRSTSSQAHAQQWKLYDIRIGLAQRSTLLARAALYELLALRLMRFRGAYGVRHLQHHVTCVMSQCNLFVSKGFVEGLFQEGQRLCEQQHFSAAAKSLGKAALMLHASSCALLARMLSEGNQDVNKDPELAFDLASVGAAFGCAHSKGVLGWCYVSGRGVDQNVERGLALARESAAAGSKFGQFVMGLCYEEGHTGTQNHVKAVISYHLSAKQGHPGAQCNLGIMFEKGLGVNRNNTEAVRWFQLAAAQGYARAQCNLGNMFLIGLGVYQNKAEARRWLQLAEAQGDQIAYWQLRNKFTY